MGFEAQLSERNPRVWQVGALCHAIADALEARFNPVTVRGELTGFSRASSGHCYFAIKDETGQIRCAMFRRAASLMDFAPRDGELVELRGRLGVYEERGDLQLIVESMSRAGQGALFEQFLRLKAQLEAEGLFEPGRKRALPAMPRAIGLVTSLGAAALHDVVSTLQRRVPHIPVILSPAAVQGAGASAELCRALSGLYPWAESSVAPIDVILLVRGGGSIEDLWAFNDEGLARLLAKSPVPVVSGVGHETDFTIADFVADLRAPTPTAAAELVAQPREMELGRVTRLAERLHMSISRRLDFDGQQLDGVAAHLMRPSVLVERHRLALLASARRLQFAAQTQFKHHHYKLHQSKLELPHRVQRGLDRVQQRLTKADLRLGLLDPSLILQRGYAWVSDAAGQSLTRAQDLSLGQKLRLHLAQGQVGVTVDELDPK